MAVRCPLVPNIALNQPKSTLKNIFIPYIKSDSRFFILLKTNLLFFLKLYNSKIRKKSKTLFLEPLTNIGTL